MPSRLLLLTGSAEAAALGPLLRRHNAAAQIIPVAGLAELEARIDRGVDTRLIAFCTATIVPAALLARLERGAYNIHPGPPSYPGRYPSCWGSYDGVRRFGATLHEMAARVDEGRIIAVECFAVDPPIGQTALSNRVFRAAIELLQRFAPALACAPDLAADPMISWSGRKTRLADFEAMCRLSPDIDAAEFERRRRAFADAPGARLSVLLHGHRFIGQMPDGAAKG